MRTIDEIINRLDKYDSEYDLGNSDFAQTISTPSNGLVDIQLMQRNFKYKDCIVIGNQNVSSGSKGIVLFISKSKIPCFIPIFFVNDSTIQVNSGDVVFKTQKLNSENEFPQTEFINLRNYIRENGLSEGVHFSYRINSPESQHWATRETVVAISNIIKDWFVFTNGQSKLIPGDLSEKTGGTFDTHKGRGHATGRAIDMYMSNGLENNSLVNKNNKQQIINLFDIIFKNGALQIGWIPPDFLKGEIEQRYKGKVRYWGGHASHFHIGFIKE